jgi:hypothetical protein
LNPILACTSCADDWRQFLAHPDRHWKERHSAHALATAWQGATGLPSEISRVMATTLEFRNAEPLIAIPEYRVPLPGGRRSSQSDLLVLGRADGGAFAMVVEGKVAETFGPLVHEWLAQATPGRLLRWSFLCNLLGVDGARAVPFATNSSIEPLPRCWLQNFTMRRTRFYSCIHFQPLGRDIRTTRRSCSSSVLML